MQVIADNQKLVMQIVYRLISDEENRKDLVQEIFIKVYAGLPKFSFQSKLSTWIGSIAYNHSVHFLEKKKHISFSELTDTGEDEESEPLGYNHLSQSTPEDILSKKLVGDVLNREMETLPKLSQTLLVLYHIEDKSYEEIALITNLPMGTVKSYLFRARKQLKKLLLSKYTKEELWK
jgi:RNA polymerase sigma-70 factor (ECF subfamily)